MMLIIRIRGIVRAVGLSLCLMLFSAAAFAQSTGGTIGGSVIDDSGSALKGASVQVLPLGLTGTTDINGEFTLTGVAPGHYTLAVSFVGFQ